MNNQERLNSFLEIEENWYEPGTPKIDPKCIDAAKPICLILENMLPNIKLYVFPTLHGGVQLEWQFEKKDYEIEIIPAGDGIKINHLMMWFDGKIISESEI